MLASLQAAANAAGQPEWGRSGPHDAGSYNAWSSDTGFFVSHGSWDSEYGRFFLGWYSGLLTAHGNRVLAAARDVVTQRCRPRAIHEARELADGGVLYVFRPAVQLGVKLAGVHWCAGGADGGGPGAWVCGEARAGRVWLWAGSP